MNKKQKYRHNQYLKHRNEYIELSKKYYKDNRERLLLARKTREGAVGSHGWLNKRFLDKRRRAKEFGREFKITLEDYRNIFDGWSCFYCGSTDKFTLDRKDNTKGYILDNLVACCNDCNHLKSNILNFEEMKILGQAFIDINKSIKNRGINGKYVVFRSYLRLDT